MIYYDFNWISSIWRMEYIKDSIYCKFSCVYIIFFSWYITSWSWWMVTWNFDIQNCCYLLRCLKECIVLLLSNLILMFAHSNFLVMMLKYVMIVTLLHLQQGIHRATTYVSFSDWIYWKPIEHLFDLVLKQGLFMFRYPPHGRRTIPPERGVQWERLRAPPVDKSAHELHISDCLNELRPGDHIEIQWKRNKEFPYGEKFSYNHIVYFDHFCCFICLMEVLV